MDCPNILTLIGKRIRFLRKERKLSQERLSELAGLHPTSLSDIEHGKVNGFICNYSNIALALEVSLADLVDTSSDIGDIESWYEVRTLMGRVKTLDEKKRAVYLDSAIKLLERIESI
jgi:transcriptional regulator with XRE-family HTH domain